MRFKDEDGLRDKFGLQGEFLSVRYEDREVLREMERADPEGERIARLHAVWRAVLAGKEMPRNYEEVQRLITCNTVADAYYDLVFDTMLKGDAYTENVRAGVFGNDVIPGAGLLITTFRATLGEATGYTVDGGNSTNRSTTTFAASASQSITNSATPSRFTFTGADTIYGAFITQGATLKDGTQDTAPAVYVAGGQFSVDQPVASGTIIDVVYTHAKV